MRGKNGHAAAVRREWQELERERDKLAETIATLTEQARQTAERHARQLDAVYRENRALKKQVDEGTSGALQLALNVNERLQAERDAAVAERAKTVEMNGRAVKVAQSAFMRLGMSKMDAFDAVASISAGQPLEVNARPTAIAVGNSGVDGRMAVRAMEQKGSGRSQELKEQVIAEELNALEGDE